MFESVYSLHGVSSGRLFIRQGAEGRTTVVGVIEVPRAAPFEQLTMARINSGMWLDLQNARPVDDPFGEFGGVGIAHVLTSQKFRAHALSDALDVFVRRSFLAHEDPLRQWAIVGGVAPGRLAAASAPGVYEIRPDGLCLVDPRPFVGEALLSVLREPVWGPGGKFGLATDMEPSVAAQEIARCRELSMRRDPKFRVYVEAMVSAGLELPMAYTEQELREHEVRAAELTRKIFLQSRQDELEELHRAVVQRP